MMRRATPGDVALMLGWAAAEGWNPGLEDAEAFRAADPEGFFVAERDGAPVAGISVVNHSDSFAFLGLYLCLPEHRGRGIGLALWRHALGHAGARCVGLDGVADQQANYAKSGFVPAGSTTRLEGPVRHLAASAGIRPLAPRDMAEVGMLDLAATGVGRPAFLQAWTMARPTRRTLVLERQGRVTGFATARLCRRGCKLGPVIAPDAQAALALMRAAAQTLGAGTVVIDLPHHQTQFRLRLASLGFAETFGTARMYLGQPPEVGPQAFAIATMELG